MPKPSVSATRLAGRAPVAVTVTPGRTPPSGPRTRPSMAPIVVWAAAAPAVKPAARSQRQIDPRLVLHIPHLLMEQGSRRGARTVRRDRSRAVGVVGARVMKPLYAGWDPDPCSGTARPAAVRRAMGWLR